MDRRVLAGTLVALAALGGLGAVAAARSFEGTAGSGPRDAELTSEVLPSEPAVHLPVFLSTAIAGRGTAPDEDWTDRPPEVVSGFPPPPPAYVVTASGPVRRLLVPELGVDHAIEVLAMLPDGELPTPRDAMYRVGWYADFGQPGDGGNALFSAHETWNHYQAPFYNLRKAVPGQEVLIDMTDGRRLRYVVFSNARYELATIPMAEIVWPARPAGEEWVTFITCGGRIVYDVTGFGEYLDRDVVVARRVE